MADYIEREAVTSEVYKLSMDAFRRNDRKECFCYNKVYSLLVNAPTADVAPVVHGRWVQVICHVEFEDGFVDRLYECCSRCHEPNGRKTSDYCPNCGARMDGE